MRRVKMRKEEDVAVGENEVRRLFYNPQGKKEECMALKINTTAHRCLSLLREKLVKNKK
jgi:hypothetical protein